MKQTEHKAIIKSELEAMGFEIMNDIIVTRIQNISIIIFLSTQARVLIETNGVVGTYFVILEQFKKSYSETTAQELVDVMNKYIRKVKAFKETE
jgi:hypothetical protein